MCHYLFSSSVVCAFLIRLKQNICVVPITCQKNLGEVSREIILFYYKILRRK